MLETPFFTEKSDRQSLQRKGCGLRLVRCWMFLGSQRGHGIPSGQRASTNHCSVNSGSENISAARTSEMPLRYALPGAFTGFLPFVAVATLSILVGGYDGIYPSNRNSIKGFVSRWGVDCVLIPLERLSTPAADRCRAAFDGSRVCPLNASRYTRRKVWFMPRCWCARRTPAA